MKKRNGFVSNSSSSSFCLLGIPVPENKSLKSIWDRIKDTSLDFEYGISEIEGEVIGFSPEIMKEYETLFDFKNRTVSDLEKAGFKAKSKDLEWLIDGGYDS